MGWAKSFSVGGLRGLAGVVNGSCFSYLARVIIPCQWGTKS